MKFTNLFFILFILVVTEPVLAREQLLFTNNADSNNKDLSSILYTLKLKNDVVIAFRVFSNSSSENNNNYFVLTKLSNHYGAYRIKEEMMKFDLSQEAMKTIWLNFEQNGLLDMKNEDELIDVCPKKYHIYNAHFYEFIIMDKGKTKRLSYYYPEHYDEVCPGMSERKKIINSVAIIVKLGIN